MIAQIQIALYQKLIASTALGNLIADAVDMSGASLQVPAVYDRPPQPVLAGEADYFPYVTIGDITANEFDTDDSNGFDCEIVIRCYSRTGGRLQAKQIQDAIYTELHKQDLNVNHSVMLYQQMARVDLEPDGKTYQGVQMFRFVVDML